MGSHYQHCLDGSFLRGEECTRLLRLEIGVAWADTLRRTGRSTHGVTCNAISPGYVNTNLMRVALASRLKREGSKRSIDAVVAEIAETYPQKRIIKPEEVGAIAAFLCRNEARGVTMENVTVSAARSGRLSFLKTPSDAGSRPVRALEATTKGEIAVNRRASAGQHQRASGQPRHRTDPRMWKSLFADDPLRSDLGPHYHDPPPH